MAQCTAKAKHTQERCRDSAMRGKKVCWHHGGKSLSGMASPSYKTGKYSKVLPVRLQQTYEEARANPRLLSLTDDIAAAESRLADLFQRVDTGESGALWQTLGETLEDFNAALAKNALPAMHQHLATLRRLITQGRDDYAAWAEIQALWETRCKLTLTEQKTLVAMQQMISTEQLMVYLGVITNAITRCVTAHAEPDASRAILGDLATEFKQLTVLEAR